jgi:flagellar biosynthesis protein FlhF
MPEAMKKIRDELGKDAVILNQKEVKVGGILGFFAQKKIEVVAAVDPSLQQQKPRNNPAAPTRQAQTNVQSSGLNVNVSAANQAYGAPAPASASTPVATNTSAKANSSQLLSSSPTAVKEPENQEVTIANSKDKVETVTPQVETNKAESKKQEDSVLAEIRQMKEMMVKLSTATRDSKQNPESIQKMVDHLEFQEFDHTLIEELIFHLKNELESSQVAEPTDELVQQLIRQQLEKIIYSNGVETISPDTKIVHFVGPTGVGKTTTIAKLAADQVLNHKRKVGFITADTYRIAAVEQLRTYASILNAPIEVAMSPQDLSRAYDSMKELDIIFMDTAGRNFRNEMYVSELNTMLNSSEQSETYLVLSMTMKYKDMKAVTENFSRIRIDRLLFSKMDETASYGSIVNLIHQFSIPLSYFTHGQQVPNDIEVVKEDQFIDLLMGEDKDE